MLVALAASACPQRLLLKNAHWLKEKALAQSQWTWDRAEVNLPLRAVIYAGWSAMQKYAGGLHMAQAVVQVAACVVMAERALRWFAGVLQPVSCSQRPQLAY